MSWHRRFWNWLRAALGGTPPVRDVDATADYPAPSSLTLMPGVFRLQVGVVSTVGNYREHNEDNFYVPGRPSVADGGSSEASVELFLSGSDPSLPFLVADGMGGQQAGEEASRMAVEIIPRR